MLSYKFARRSFLSAIGGAFGLETLLRNVEAAAAGAPPPPRFLMIHWPVGTMKQQFIPTGSGTSFTTAKAPPWATSGAGPGYIISPFDTAELRPYTIAMHGFNMSGISGRGGCHEDGTPFATTGANSPGTRANGGETDDGAAGGPSWDQILLKHCPTLAKRNDMGTIVGRGYYNTIADARIDSYETSTRCLSYGYTKVSITSAVPGGTIQENQPLHPTLSPLTTFNDLFPAGFMPGGGTMPDVAMIRMLKNRRSVLDYSMKELNRLNTLAPAQERVKIEAHLASVRMLEAQLSEQIRNAEMGGGGGVGCTVPKAPPMGLTGAKSDVNRDYGKAMTTRDDKDNHELVGKTHADILRAAFACDLIRCATFQWSPGTNHVAFKGCNPSAPEQSYMHHPLSHDNGSKTFFDGARPGGGNHIWDAMVWINHWYFQKTADILNAFRTTPDPLATDGSNLLDRTVCPMITEVADASHNHNGHGALIIGGTKLGMQGGQYRNVTGTHNQLWVTVAQAFLGANAVSMLSSEAYSKNGANPISGLWVAPT